jgi:hypothetical protein
MREAQELLRIARGVRATGAKELMDLYRKLGKLLDKLGVAVREAKASDYEGVMGALDDAKGIVPSLDRDIERIVRSYLSDAGSGRDDAPSGFADKIINKYLSRFKYSGYRWTRKGVLEKAMMVGGDEYILVFGMEFHDEEGRMEDQLDYYVVQWVKGKKWSPPGRVKTIFQEDRGDGSRGRAEVSKEIAEFTRDAEGKGWEFV